MIRTSSTMSPGERPSRGHHQIVARMKAQIRHDHSPKNWWPPSIVEKRCGEKKMSRRLCFVLDLVNDAELIAEYEKYHQPGGVWPVIVDDIHAQGIEGDGNLAQRRPHGDDRHGDRRLSPCNRTILAPVCDEWEALMWLSRRPAPCRAGAEMVPMPQDFRPRPAARRRC